MTLLDIARNNVLRSWRDYALHFANSVFAVTAFFLFVCLALHPEMGRAGRREHDRDHLCVVGCTRRGVLARLYCAFGVVLPAG